MNSTRCRDGCKRDCEEIRKGALSGSSGIKLIPNKRSPADDSRIAARRIAATNLLSSNRELSYTLLMDVLDHSPIASSPEVLGGALVFNGTRAPAQTLLDYLTDGFTLAQFLEFFRSVSMADAKGFFRLVEKETT